MSRAAAKLLVGKVYKLNRPLPILSYCKYGTCPQNPCRSGGDQSNYNYSKWIMKRSSLPKNGMSDRDPDSASVPAPRAAVTESQDVSKGMRHDIDPQRLRAGYNDPSAISRRLAAVAGAGRKRLRRLPVTRANSNSSTGRPAGAVRPKQYLLSIMIIAIS